MPAFSTHRDDQSPVIGTSLYTGPSPFFRDALDATRSMWRSTPSAAYPDGYIDSALNGRQADKLGTAIWRNQRAYSRGVHKGTRIDMSDYLWPREFNLMSAIVNEAETGMRYVSPAINSEPIRLTNDGKPGPHDATIGEAQAVPVVPDPNRAAQLKRLAPNWSI